MTFEIHDELLKLGNSTPKVYDFERALQAPVLEMMLRGFRIDEYARQKGIALLKSKIEILEKQLDALARAVWDKGLNPRSPTQLLSFFYGTMKLPEQWISQKGVRKLSMNRETLEKLEIYFHACPIVSTILAIRELSKKLSVLETEVDPDGRMRTSYNIGGTETWRFSSSENAFGTGTNLQNITAELRDIFVADPGYKIVAIDLEQAESREVGWLCGILFNDWSYLDACYSGDLHTLVAQGAWPDLKWPNDPKLARALAEEPFYRHLSRRDLSKKLGHGSNYYGKPFTMAHHAKITEVVAKQFQENYFSRFPGIPEWHRWTAQQLQISHSITTPFGLTRQFFGRPNDDTTLREAIAFNPQSLTAVRLNLILWRIWKYMPHIQLLAQLHDAVDFQFPEHLDEHEVVTEASELFCNSHDPQRPLPCCAGRGQSWLELGRL